MSEPKEQLIEWLHLSFECSNRHDGISPDDLETIRQLGEAMYADPGIRGTLSFAVWYDHMVTGTPLPPGILEADITHRAAQDYARLSHTYAVRGHWRAFVALLCWEIQSFEVESSVEKIAEVASQFYAMASARGFTLEEDDDGVQDAFARSFLTWLTSPQRTQAKATILPTPDKLAAARAKRFADAT